jgi:E3 SUMO-protein ligase PIAS1
MAQHRHTVGIQVKPMDYNILLNVQNDKALRVMVFACEADAGLVKHDIGFPYQSEIKVNGGEIKANLRGLKNRAGSTRPVDITDSLRLRQTAYANNIEMTYALTQKAGSQVSQVSC